MAACRLRTFLLSEANPDEALKKAVAQAMRHSTTLQGSATYDKERAERSWAAAVQVAGAQGVGLCIGPDSSGDSSVIPAAV